MLQSQLPTERDRSSGYLQLAVCDAQATGRAAMRQMLEKTGLTFHLAEAADAARLSHLLAERRFDAIVVVERGGSDAESGPSILRRIAGHPDQADVVTLMVTDAADHRGAVRALRAGCSDYLAMNEVSGELLKSALTDAVAHRAMLRAARAAQGQRGNLRRATARFLSSFGPEMRDILSAMKRQIRILRADPHLDPGLRSELTLLDRGSSDLVAFLDELSSLTEVIIQAEPEAHPHLARAM